MTAIHPVHLVGAGPGDPDLLTVKAARLLGAADVVVYDRLVSAAILALVPAGTTRISVGKSANNHPTPQAEINDLLVRLARAGHRVVRLKGGDPLVFGRGSEEALHLTARGIPFDIVPGISSAAGCTAAAGIPLTHRGLATGVRFVTGHRRDDGDLDLDWAGLADADTTLVVYMGLASIGTIRDNLVDHGLSPETPAAAIERGTTPDQRTVVATLADLPRRIAEAELRSPTLIVIGRVAALAATLGADLPDRLDAAAEAG